MFCFISKQWRLIQYELSSNIESMKSPNLWITRIQHKIWEIAWELSQHRNQFLYNDRSTIHFQEMAAIDNAITEEYMMGVGRLPVNNKVEPFLNLFEPVTQKYT